MVVVKVFIINILDQFLANTFHVKQCVLDSAVLFGAQACFT